MSTQSTHSTPEFKCPDCGLTLFRENEKRHRRTQHPDGTEVKHSCPYTGCEYKTDQRSNLRSHINARHTGYQYPCQNCSKGFSDPSALFRHRKSAHGHEPHHTRQYIARRALKKAEKKSDKALSNITRDQLSHNSQNDSSPAATVNNVPTNAAYHNNIWKPIVDVPRNAPELEDPQDVQISVPVTAAPAYDAPKTLYSDSDLPSPEVGQLQPSTWTHVGSQLNTIAQPQSQALSKWGTAYGHAIPVAASSRPKKLYGWIL